MVKVGVIGLGMMGNTHLDAYAKLDNAQVVAVADADPDRLSGKAKAGGNVEGQAQGGFDLSSAKAYDDGMKLIDDEDVQLVDICLITPLHVQFALAALAKGKHVLVEKPLARTAADAQKIVDAAKDAKGIAMVAMCMRFWPGWDWVKKATEQQTYGQVLGATFRRVAQHPGGPFYCNGSQCGGGLLDLHIHDTDFIQYCFGMPKAVYSRGYSKITDEVDHVVTQYIYDDIGLVVAEGGWAMSEGFGFEMTFTVNFQRATVSFRFDGQSHLTLAEPGKKPCQVELDAQLGYDLEIAYLIDCIEQGKMPTTVTLQSAADTLRIADAEAQSVKTGQTVTL